MVLDTVGQQKESRNLKKVKRAHFMTVFRNHSGAPVVASATVSKTPIQYQYLLLVGALRVPVAPPMQVAVADMAASIHRTRAGCRTRTFAISFLETQFLN